MREIWFKVKYNKNYPDYKNTDPDVMTDSCEYGETECLLRLPDSYSEVGEKTPLIFSAHGSGGRVSKEEDHHGGVEYVSELIDAGYAAFDIHGTRPDGRSYGNARYIEAVHRAYLYITEHFNVDKRLFVMGASMGGVCALNFVNFYPGIVRAVGLFFPRTNLNSVNVDGCGYWGSWSREKKPDKDFYIRDIISEEFGFEKLDVYEKEKTVGLDPWYNRTLTVDNVRYTFFPCPIKIWHGNADQSVQYDLSVEYVAGIRRAGGFAELRTLEGRGHKRTSIMRRELLLWFDRFR